MPHFRTNIHKPNTIEYGCQASVVIALFIQKGAAIGKSRAGQVLYSAPHAWLHRVRGGPGVANVFACALSAAMAGSSPDLLGDRIGRHPPKCATDGRPEYLRHSQRRTRYPLE